ncbi:tyrosine-protein kinase family protein [Aeoliella sp.]|uniref:tyrosine-protein kinase family protein n=1 Tax=Aeoliella sp. TaxID=2795800 RepID=UPI003CCBE183
MTATNKAFIDAYNSSPSRPVARHAPQQPLELEPLMSSSQIVLSEPFTFDSANLPEVQPAQPNATELSDAKQPAVRRPLSQVQAGELFGINPAPARTSEPQWPEGCQQLIARAADRFDSLLRQVPSSSTGTLIGVAGVAPGVGCTTTALCLALRSSALGLRAALVDANLPSFGLGKMLELDHYTSWTDALVTGESILNTAHTATEVGVDLLLARSLPDAQLSSTARFRTSLAAGALRRQYDRVVIDLGCPTSGQSAADLAAAMGVDYLIACRTPAANDDQVASTVAAMGEFGVQVNGLVEAA